MTRREILASFALQAAADPKVILDQSVTLDEENLRKLRGYVWASEETAYVKGKMVRRQNFEINLVSGAMYWRKTGDLTETERRDEALRLERHLKTHAPGHNWRLERQYLELLPSVHEVRLTGEEVLDGRPNYVLETKPFRNTVAPLLRSQEYRLWVDKAELHWRKAEIRAVRDVRWMLHQLAVGRISYPYSNGIVNTGDLDAGALTTIELQRLPDGVWTLARHETRNGRDYRNELRYYDYRRYSSESQLLPGAW